MPSIVQFLHSGLEHPPDRGAKNYKAWNKGKHKRKFLCNHADYVVNSTLQTGHLFFWNEWEPESYVSPLAQNKNPLLPRWLHKPRRIFSVPNGVDLENTDPFIFDNEFKYFVCLQMKRRKLSEARIQTAMARLDKGSLILFGSKTQIKGRPIFQLDTVFVVSDYLDYNPRTKPLTVADIGQTYYDYAYSKLFFGFRPNVNLRLYKGATYQNQISEMYSFVPGQVALTANTGFSRVVINGAPTSIHG